VPVQDDEQAILDEAHLLTSKKVLYVANVSEKVLKEDGPYIAKVREVAAKEGSGVVGDLRRPRDGDRQAGPRRNARIFWKISD